MQILIHNLDRNKHRNNIYSKQAYNSNALPTLRHVLCCLGKKAFVAKTEQNEMRKGKKNCAVMMMAALAGRSVT